MSTDLEYIVELKEMLESIAVECDHAMERDGVGFSKSTALVGHMLNALDPEYLSDDMVETLESVLRTHRRQLPDPKVTDKFKGSSRKDVVQPFLFTNSETGKYRFWTPVRDLHVFNVAKALSMGYQEVTPLPISEGFLIELDSIEFVEYLIAELYRNAPINAISVEDSKNSIKVFYESYIEEFPEINFCIDKEFFLGIVENKTTLPKPNKAAFHATFTNAKNFQYDKLKISFAAPMSIRTEYMFEDHQPSSEDSVLYSDGNLVINEVNYFGNNIRALSLDDMNEIAKKHCGVEEATIHIDVNTLEAFISTHNRKYVELEKASNRMVFDGNKVQIYFIKKDEILNLVRKLSSRRFTTSPSAHWVATLTLGNIDADLKILKQLIEDYGVADENNGLVDAITLVTGDDCYEPSEEPAYDTNIKFLDGAFAITFAFDYSRLNELKEEIFHKYRKFDAATSSWTVELNKHTIKAIKVLMDLGWHTEFSEEDLNKFANEATKKVNHEKKAILKRTKLSKAINVNNYNKELLGGSLYAFQHVPVHYSDVTESFFIADDMGTGKTIQALAIAEHHDFAHTFILCPMIASPTWEKEILKFCPKLTSNDILRIKDVKTEITAQTLDKKFTIIHYDIFKKCLPRIVEAGIKFDALIVDESHKIKNPKSQRSDAALKICNELEIKHKYLLSGSITTGKPKDLIHQLKILGLLDSVFGGFTEFTTRYCDGHKNEAGYYVYDGASNLEELHEKLSAHCMVRRRKKDVLKDLPTKLRSTVEVEISNISRYKAAEKQVVSQITELLVGEAIEKMEKMEKMAKPSDFDQISYFSQYVQDNIARLAASTTVVGDISKLKSLAAEGKVKPAIDWIKNYLDNDVRSPLVVFANSVKAQEQIYKAISEMENVNCEKLGAKTSADKKSEIVEQFQCGEIDVLVAALKSASVNITLTAASTALFVDVIDESDHHIQAEDRILRIGSTGDSVECVYLIDSNTIDADVWERHTIKVKNFALVQDGMVSDEFDLSKAKNTYLNKLISSISDSMSIA